MRPATCAWCSTPPALRVGSSSVRRPTTPSPPSSRAEAAHAGVQPEEGISAIRMAADAIGRMELGRLDAGTTANVGSIEGGGATNVIAARCALTGECRSLDRERVESVRSAMDFAMRSAAAEHGGERGHRVDSRVRGVLGRRGRTGGAGWSRRRASTRGSRQSSTRPAAAPTPTCSPRWASTRLRSRAA